MIEQKYKDYLISTIKKHIPRCKIYLYGSRATGKATEGSDIDLAIDAGKKVSFLSIIDIKSEIEDSTIPYFVDIVDWNNVSQTFKNVVKNDLVLWNNN